ncbi:hypothetical protein [Mesorhizobium sp. SP-1A]|jgi:hypothetical protein|uniref:hypothetical protein n=1 Tax=Mesorhizobium sp. SP-1A TaxID=3077840 RepID=UPI0028F6EA6C|nr:hypothetical protein [Mesorhizobium sp. SP-1A]
MTSAAPARANWRLISLAIVAAGVLLFVGANAHLVYVAFASQPACVPHLKAAGEKGGATPYRAADSAC